MTKVSAKEVQDDPARRDDLDDLFHKGEGLFCLVVSFGGRDVPIGKKSVQDADPALRW